MIHPQLGAGRAALLVALVLATGCAAESRRSDEPAAEIRLAVYGGAHAGTVDVQSQEVICTHGIVGGNSWGVQFTDPQLTTPLGSMQLIVPPYTASGPTRRFYLGVVFESFLEGVDHEIETREGASRPGGDGVVSVTRQDTSAALTVTGHTADGVGISARINCRRLRDTQQEMVQP